MPRNRSHESLNYDTWLWDQTALSDNDPIDIDELCPHGAPYDPDTGVPDCRECARDDYYADNAYENV